MTNNFLYVIINYEKIFIKNKYIVKGSTMKKCLIIPLLNEIQQCISLAEKYNLGFEYNDFYHPDVLDSIEKQNDIIRQYKALKLPDYCTIHGAFFDVTIFSYDKKICEISELRVIQSIEAAKKVNARAVVFHTNINPILNLREYENNWLKSNISFWSRILSDYPDINIYIENMFDQSPEMLKRLAENLCCYSNFGVCFDYAHATISSTPMKIWIDSLCKYVKHVHINDNDLKADLHLAVSDGKIDWQEFKSYYNDFLSETTLLIEVSSVERQIRSIEALQEINLL